MANKNLFSSLLSTITTIGSLSIMASCGYDAYKNAKNSANADVYELNMHSQFNNPINANMLINNPYQPVSYINSNQVTNLQNLGAKTKGWLKGAVKSLSSNFITLSTAALGAIFSRNYLGKLFFIGSIASIFGKNLFNVPKLSNKQLNSVMLNKDQAPYLQISNIPLSPVASNISYINQAGMYPNIPVYGSQIISPATPYIPNNSPYIPYQQQQQIRLF